MTVEKYDDVNKANDEPDIAVVADAVPAGDAAYFKPDEPPIPAGHSRFYCNKCRAPYDLPDRATSWRCANCSTFNSTTPGECDWCSIM